jgi:hypothetical protein
MYVLHYDQRLNYNQWSILRNPKLAHYVGFIVRLTVHNPLYPLLPVDFDYKYTRWLSSKKTQEKFRLAIDIHRTSIYILVLLIYNYGAHGKYKLVLQTYNFKTTTELDITAMIPQS